MPARFGDLVATVAACDGHHMTRAPFFSHQGPHTPSFDIVSELDQMLDTLCKRMAGRHIDLRALEMDEVESNLAGARRKIIVKQHLEQGRAKKIIARIKDAKLKFEAQINGDKLRLNGKKRDDLQAVIALLRKAELGVPVQFGNFRD